MIATCVVEFLMVFKNKSLVQSQRPLMKHVIWLLLFALVSGLAGINAMPPLDRDESRFMQASVQMMETGDYINIRFQGDERNKKPAGIHWLQSLSVKTFSSPEARDVWAFRMPSYIASLISVVLCYLIGCKLFTRQTALLGALLLASAPSFTGEATIAKTDSVLLATVLLTQWALANIYIQGLKQNGRISFSSSLLFWVGLGLGIMIKGPITPMIAILTITAICLIERPFSKKRLQLILGWLLKFRPITGLFILCLIVGPWALAIAIETEGRFFQEALGTDMLGKVNQPQENHAGPIGYYLIAVWGMFWTAALFIPLTLRHFWRDLPHSGILFLLAWTIPTWLVFEIASTKLPHYTLPVYPALALMIAHCLTSLNHHRPSKYLLSKTLGSLAYLGVGLLVTYGLFAGATRFNETGVTGFTYILALCVLTPCIIAIIFYWRNRYQAALISSSITGALLAWVLYQSFLPNLTALQMSPAISNALVELDRHPRLNAAPVVAMVEYHEPSAVFLLGTNTRLGIAEEAADWLKQASGHIAIVESRDERAFLEAMGETPYTKLTTLQGYNYSNAIDVVLTLYISD